MMRILVQSYEKGMEKIPSGVLYSGALPISRLFYRFRPGGEIVMVNPDNTTVSLLITKSIKSNTADIEYLPEENLQLGLTFLRIALLPILPIPEPLTTQAN